MVWVTHVHDVVKNNECCTLCFLLIPYPDLPNAPVASEQIVEVFAGDLVVQILDEEDSIRARWQFCLGTYQERV